MAGDQSRPVAAHPMHLHGFFFHVDSRGDWRSERTFRGDGGPFAVTQLLNAGETVALSWVPEREGNWVFHCHFAFHVSHHLALGGDDADPSTAPRVAAISTVAATEEHSPMPHRMSGLVLGIHVVPGATPAPRRATDRPPREIRLLAQTAPRRYGTLAGMGYVVQEGGAEPARDSIDVPGPTLVLRRGRAGADHRRQPPRRADGGPLARHRAGELPRRRARLERHPGPPHARDPAGRQLRRRVRAAARGDVHLSHPRQRAAPDGERPLRRAAGRGLDAPVRSRDRQGDPGRRRRARPTRCRSSASRAPAW